MTCSALIVGGWDRGPDDQGYFGIKLDLPIRVADSYYPSTGTIRQ